MKFRLDIFDAEPKGQEKLIELPAEVTEPQEESNQLGEAREVIQVCRVCKKREPVSKANWKYDWWLNPPETDEEKIERLLGFVKVYVERDNLLRHLEVLPITYAILSDTENGIDGKAMFESMDASTRAMFSKAAKRALDYVFEQMMAIK